MTTLDVVKYRSWLLGKLSALDVVLSSFRYRILEMIFCGVIPHHVAARVSIRERCRYEEPVTSPREKR